MQCRHALFLYVVFTGLVLFVSCTAAPPLSSEKSLVGGPCRYKNYSGQATILSVTAVKKGAADETGRFEVRFSFQPHDEIKEGFAQVDGKTFLLHGKIFQNPDRNFIAAHRLHAGRVLDGIMQVIVSGTCTPVIFDFPALADEK